MSHRGGLESVFLNVPVSRLPGTLITETAIWDFFGEDVAGGKESPDGTPEKEQLLTCKPKRLAT